MRRAPSSLLLLIALTALLARAEHAHACSCRGPRITISPSGTDAPINSTIVVWLPHEAPAREVLLSVRAKDGDTLEVDYRSVGSGMVKVIEMTPRAKLRPNTTYEVVRGERVRDVTSERYTETVIGELTTGTRVLAKVTPAFKGFTTSNFHQDKRICCNCSTGDPYAILELVEPIDDAKVDVRFGIWMAGADGKLDYRRPPVTYLRGTHNLWLGHPSSCSPDNFRFPKHKALRLGVRLIDLAGNASAPVEVVLDTTRPTTRR